MMKQSIKLVHAKKKIARNSLTAYKNSLTGDSPYDLGESHNLYVWGSSAVYFRDGRNIMKERCNGIVQEYQTGSEDSHHGFASTYLSDLRQVT
jgi:hypothetical protein